LNIFTEKLNYSNGETQQFTNPTNTRILGKPYDFEIRLKDVKDDAIKAINNGELFLITYLKNACSFGNKTLNKVSDNLIRAVDREYQNIITELTLTTQRITEIEQKIVNNFTKLDFVVTERDGYIKSDQQVFVYKTKSITTSGDTLAELKTDYKKASDKLLDYYNVLKNEKLVEYKVDYGEFSPDFDKSRLIKPVNNQEGNAKFWVIMSRIFLDENEYNRLLTEITPSQQIIEGGLVLSEEIKKSMDVFKYSCKSFKDIQKKKFDETKVKLDVFKKWDPFVKGLERKLTFNETEKGNSQDENRLKNIYKQGNSNNDKKTFQGKNIFL
jgi:hypothetical protein